MSEARSRNIARMRQIGAFDVIVVGGGINGIGVFRDLALQGLSVLLVERNDFCSGCSAAPSRMIHGGLRYLENGEFGLVRESLREREALLLNAPHMVRVLPTTIPIKSLFSGTLNAVVGFLGGKSRPARRGILPVKLGLLLYDWVTRRRRLTPRHALRNARETAEKWPSLTTNLRCSATYYDAWISHPERLGIEIVLDTQRDSEGAIALNYAEIERDGSLFSIRDRLTGDCTKVSARLVVNATGAWLDETIARLAGPAGPNAAFVSGTKGSHLVIDNRALHDALDGHMIFFENSDGRICIVFPYLGNVLAGSTDIRVAAAARTRCETEERDYILDALHLVFPKISVTTADVVFSFSGIRPLPKSDHDFTGRISRGHSVERIEDDPPQLCMVGGKWTTFRAFAEETTDMALQVLRKPRLRNTLSLAIGGGADFPVDQSAFVRDIASAYGLDRDRAAHLVDTYGSRSKLVADFCQSYASDVPLDSGTRVSTGEIAFLIREEYAETLGDLALRRTTLAIQGELSMNHIDRIAAVASTEFGWDESRRHAEKAKLVTELETYYGVSEAMLCDRDRHGRT
jgi:glycerol-3-phosphate dehydrogenase